MRLSGKRVDIPVACSQRLRSAGKATPGLLEAWCRRRVKIAGRIVWPNHDVVWAMVVGGGNVGETIESTEIERDVFKRHLRIVGSRR